MSYKGDTQKSSSKEKDVRMSNIFAAKGTRCLASMEATRTRAPTPHPY